MQLWWLRVGILPTPSPSEALCESPQVRSSDDPTGCNPVLRSEFPAFFRGT